MDKLLTFIKTLDADQRAGFFKRCNTSEAYIRKLAYTKKPPGELLSLRLAYESRGAVTPYELRPDVNWAFVARAARALLGARYVASIDQARAA
jgi:DNA-binding transcriptional regulator YdaS (Cro superfamily)